MIFPIETSYLLGVIEENVVDVREIPLSSGTYYYLVINTELTNILFL